MSSVVSSSRRRAALVLASVGGLLLSLLVATPAQAATTCGDWKTVRVSILYRACTSLSATNRSSSKIEVQNNHGSAVDEVWQYGIGIGDGAITWKITIYDRFPAGRSNHSAGGPGLCNIRIRFAVRAANTAGEPPPWGAVSYNQTTWRCG